MFKMFSIKKINHIAKKLHGEHNTLIKIYIYDEKLQIIVPLKHSNNLFNI